MVLEDVHRRQLGQQVVHRDDDAARMLAAAQGVQAGHARGPGRAAARARRVLRKDDPLRVPAGLGHGRVRAGKLGREQGGQGAGLGQFGGVAHHHDHVAPGAHQGQGQAGGPAHAAAGHLYPQGPGRRKGVGSTGMARGGRRHGKAGRGQAGCQLLEIHGASVPPRGQCPARPDTPGRRARQGRGCADERQKAAPPLLPTRARGKTACFRCGACGACRAQGGTLPGSALRRNGPDPACRRPQCATPRGLGRRGACENGGNA